MHKNDQFRCRLTQTFSNFDNLVRKGTYNWGQIKLSEEATTISWLIFCFGYYKFLWKHCQ